MNLTYREITERYPAHHCLGGIKPADTEVFNVGGDGFAHPVDILSNGACESAEGKRPSIRLVTKFIFVMQHEIGDEQKLCVGNREIIEVADKALLNVPEDPNLGRGWFVQRAEEIVSSVGGIAEGDTLHVMGQQQLAMAVSAIGRKAGANLVESCTKRDSVEKNLPDGKVVKTAVFTFTGFRLVHNY